MWSPGDALLPPPVFGGHRPRVDRVLYPTWWDPDSSVYGKGALEFRPQRSHGSAGSLHNVHGNRMLHCRSSFRISRSGIWRQPA